MSEEMMSGIDEHKRVAGKRQAARKKRALTVEDLFTSVSTVKAHGDFPPPPRYVLSPRSATACLREGVDPEQLRIRDLDSFREPGIDASRQEMRYKAYAERRHSLMRNLRSTRTAVIIAEVAKQRNILIAEQMKAEEAKKESRAIEMKAKRQQRRQQKEIEQVMAFEMKAAQIQDQAQLRLEQKIKRVERKKREVLRRQKLKAEEQRRKNLKRQAMEELEEKKRRALATQAYIKEQQLNEEKKRKDRVREKERMQKAEERQQEKARILKQQADAVAARLAKMNKAEQVRKAILRKQKEDNKLAMQRKREMIRRRIETSQLNFKEIQAKKKIDYDNRLRESQQRRKQKELQAELERKEQAKLNEWNERKRRIILEDRRREEEVRVRELMARQESGNEALAQVMQQQERMHGLKRERIIQSQEQKRLNVEHQVERQKRIAEYNRLKTSQKIKFNLDKMNRIEREKQLSLQKRKAAWIQVKIQRDHQSRRSK